jgi:hypothetical protein
MKHTIFDISGATWGVARKTKNIFAAPATHLIHPSLIASVLLDTPEGQEPINPDNFICRGLTGEVWQQTPKAINRKYDNVAEAADGWDIYRPKPENSAEFFFATGEMLAAQPEWPTVIQGLWGETIDGIPNLQRFAVGDAICRQPTDHSDVWVVRRHFFDNTYEAILNGA